VSPSTCHLGSVDVNVEDSLHIQFESNSNLNAFLSQLNDRSTQQHFSPVLFYPSDNRNAVCPPPGMLLYLTH
jgi:hypothetical protein